MIFDDDETYAMVVDKDIDTAKNIKTVLHDTGMKNVQIFKDIENAADFLEYRKVMFVILDMEVDKKSLAFVKNLRSNIQSDNYKVPIIALSQNTTLEYVSSARDAGITEFVAKPFSTETLTKMIEYIQEHTRNFIISRTYKGPDRRRRKGVPPPDGILKRASDFDEDDL